MSIILPNPTPRLFTFIFFSKSCMRFFLHHKQSDSNVNAVADEEKITYVTNIMSIIVSYSEDGDLLYMVELNNTLL